MSAEDVVLGHVSMTYEVYSRLTPQERLEAWNILISKLGITEPYIPVPFGGAVDGTVGLNLVALRGSDQ